MNWINTLDLLVLGAFLIFMGLGAWKGLVRTLFQTASWVSGTAGAWIGGPYIAGFLKANIQGVPAFGLTAFSGFLGFIVCFVVVRLLGMALHKWVDKSVLGSLNRWGGVLMGAMKAALLTILVFLLLEILPLQGNLLQLRETSKSYAGWTWVRTQFEKPTQMSIIPFQNGRIR